MFTGGCPFNRPRSSSLDPFIDSAFSIEPNTSSPSKAYIKGNTNLAQLDETSYLVIGGGQVRKEQDYVNYHTANNGINKTSIMRLDKPETSSNGTTFTVAPSITSSSTSGRSSTAPLSPLSMQCELKSPSSLHDSTISRLIDGVSLTNSQDTCGSISALIGQFETTVNQSDLTTISHDHTPSCRLDFKPTTPKPLQDFSSSLMTNTASANKRLLTSPQRGAQKNNNVKAEILSQTEAPTCAILSSPETADLEEVYTILDEEVLSPISVYNLKKKTVHVQADTLDCTPTDRFRSSPAEPPTGLGKEHTVGWNDMAKKRGEREEIEEAEESVYEEVYDPPEPIPEIEWGTSERHIGSSVNNNSFKFLHDSAGNAFSEVEINVDEDPLEMLTSPRHASQWEEHLSPTKRHAIYQNQESTLSYSMQKQSSSYCDYQQQCQSNASSAALSHSPCPKNHQLFNHLNKNNHQPSPLHRQINSRSSNHSPFHQNSYPIPQRNSEALNRNNKFSSSSTQQRSYSSSQIQDGQGNKPPERERVRYFHNGFSPSENLPGHSVVSVNVSRDRGPHSPLSACEGVYSHLNYQCFSPQSESPAPPNTEPQCQIQIQASGPRQLCKPNTSLNKTMPQSQPESRVSLSNVGLLSTQSLSGKGDSISSSSCKSKSLGDLTSEDISCNFQSKYHIISRSFITPHMRKQRRRGTTGEGTFQSQSCDPLTEQLRKLVSLEGDDSDRDGPQPPHLHPGAKAPLSRPQTTNTNDVDGSPPLLTRRLSSRSLSRVRHINSRARERQQEALKPRTGVTINDTASIGGIVLRNKPSPQNPQGNRHSTGSYIAGYLGHLEDRGLPEGACTSLYYGNGDKYGDRYYTDDSLPPADSNHSASEPEVYFLLRL